MIDEAAYDAADGARRFAKRGIEEIKAKVAKIDSRLQAVEAVAHPPFDFAALIKRIEALERWQDFSRAAHDATRPSCGPRTREEEK